jgi:hypothetical protein
MKRTAYLIAATVLGIGAFAQTASAQDFNTATFGGTTIWAGGGVQFLDLPDIRFTGKGDPGDFHRQKNSDFSEYGGSAGVASRPRSAIGGAIASPAALRASGPMSTATIPLAAELAAWSSIRPEP